MTRTPDTQFIVAEVSKNWVDGQSLTSLLIAEQFEHVIEVNRQRGYKLLTFSLHRLMISVEEMNETIIAVFEREGHHGGSESREG